MSEPPESAQIDGQAASGVQESRAASEKVDSGTVEPKEEPKDEQELIWENFDLEAFSKWLAVEMGESFDASNNWSNKSRCSSNRNNQNSQSRPTTSNSDQKSDAARRSAGGEAKMLVEMPVLGYCWIELLAIGQLEIAWMNEVSYLQCAATLDYMSDERPQPRSPESDRDEWCG
jgi:hypothetical protein